MSRCRRGGFLLTDAFRIDRLSSLTLFSFGRAGVDYLFYFDRDRSGLFYFHTLILFLFILFRSRQEWIILFSYSYFISIATGVGISIIYFGVGYFSVDRSFSVRPNLGRVGFSCGESGEIISLDSE
jgi:hypothetical protein